MPGSMQGLSFQNLSLPAIGAFFVGYQIVRYALIAGTAYAVVWWLGRERFSRYKIDPGPARIKDVRREIGWSFATFLLFAVLAMGLSQATRLGWTKIYASSETYPLAWIPISVVVLLAIHDLYFYVIHRSMHHPWLYRHFHAVHHRSLSPTPFAAFAFHPLEAVLEAGIITIFAFIIPLHPIAIFSFQIASLLINVYGHLGHDFLNEHLRERHWFWRWLNTTLTHHEHHRRFEGNYGLYTTVWDRWLGTYVQPRERRRA